MKCSLIVLPLVISSLSAAEFEWKQGDIIGYEGFGGQAEMIKAASNSPWTHVGVVIIDSKGKKRVFEAVQPVRFSLISTFIKRSKNYKVMRLKNPVVLTPAKALAGKNFIKKYHKKNYDFKFMWGDDKMYCSELVWKCYKQVLGVELCTPRTFESFNLTDPKVKKAIKNRFGGMKNLPKNHKIVSPADVMDSKLLKDVTAASKR